MENSTTITKSDCLFAHHLSVLLSALLSVLKSDWLPLHDPILNANFSPITALLRRSAYHKSAKVSPPPFPQISRAPQINE